MESLLQKCTRVIETPFPHVIIENALSDDLYRELYDSLPTWQQIIPRGKHNKNNVRGNLFYRDIINEDYPQIWKDFLAYHVSKKFFSEFVYWFGPCIKEQLPLVEKYYGPLEKISVRVKSKNKVSFCQDAMISSTTPVTEISAVRRQHIDGLNKLSAGLFYMKDPDDNAGGNLELYECEGKGTFVRNVYSNINYPIMKKVAEVKYSANTFVMLLNTRKSVHAVSPRQPTIKARTFVNLHSQFDKNIIQV